MIAPVIAVFARDIEPKGPAANFPIDLVARLGTREKRPLGDLFRLTRFGVNLTQLGPGAASAFLHVHSHQDEFVYVLQGTPTLRTEQAEMVLKPSMCAGFAAGGPAHHLVNETSELVLVLEIGDRSRGDFVRYPDEDLVSVMDEDGTRQFMRRDGSSFDAEAVQP